MYKKFLVLCIFCLNCINSYGIEICDIIEGSAYDNFLSKISFVKGVDKYRKKITEQIALRVLNFDYAYKQANIAAARLYYQDDDSFEKETPKTWRLDILLEENDNFLWSSNQQVPHVLNIANIRPKETSSIFDGSFYENFVDAEIFYKKQHLGPCFFNSKKLEKEVDVQAPQSHVNNTIPKSFMGKISSEILHSEQFIIYMLTNAIDQSKFNNVSKVFLVIVSRFGPCEKCLKSLTSEVIHRKILQRIGTDPETTKFNILFFYLNKSNLYNHNPINVSVTGNKKIFTNKHHRLIIVSPDVFIKDKSIIE